jgi:hypothetical protein
VAEDATVKLIRVDSRRERAEAEFVCHSVNRNLRSCC